MQRIVILGNAGSGKSTLARTLGKHLDVPVVHLDKLFWEPGWVEPDAEQFRARVKQAVASDAWICEGNYSRRTFDLRLPRAQLVIWLDTPRTTCFRRVIMRSLLNRPRADMPAGCSEKLDRAFLTFLNFVWTFDRDYRPSIEAMRLAVGPQVPVVHLRGARQIAAFLAQLPKPAQDPYPLRQG
ncbi:AAA family ATPase [Pseudomonas caricapapayae]|uniref:AAA family ATPase n=1 Tax=Pseudomonas caricapapayae TaxID=46678 RepID=A0ACC7LXJ8_9PSED